MDCLQLRRTMVEHAEGGRRWQSWSGLRNGPTDTHLPPDPGRRMAHGWTAGTRLKHGVTVDDREAESLEAESTRASKARTAD